MSRRKNGKLTSKTMINSRNLSIVNKLECTDENAQISVQRLLQLLYKESQRFDKPQEMYVQLLLCTAMTVLTNSSEDKATIENNTQYFSDFINSEMEIAIKNKFNEVLSDN